MQLTPYSPSKKTNLSLKASQELTLSSLKPRPGDPVRLELRLPKARYSVRFIGLHEQQAIMVSAPKTRKTHLTEGTVIQVKQLIGNRLVSYSSRLLKAHTEPFGYWVISYPKQLDIQIFREHTRVPVHLSVLVDKGDSDVQQPARAVCVDMSLQGVSIEAPVALASVNDKIFITARVSVAGIEQVILANGVVRSVMQTESQMINVFRHGVEFEGLDDEIGLILSGYLYQQWLYEAGELIELERVQKR